MGPQLPPPPSPLDPALDAALRDSAQRAQLNPMQIADALEKLQKAGWIDDPIQEAFSFSHQQILQYGRLLKLPPPVQDLIRQAKLGFSQAREVSRLLENHKTLIETAASRIIQEGMVQREAGDYITSLIKPQTPAAQEIRNDKAVTHQYAQYNEVTHRGEPAAEKSSKNGSDTRNISELRNGNEQKTQTNEVTHSKDTPGGPRLDAFVDRRKRPPVDRFANDEVVRETATHRSTGQLILRVAVGIPFGLLCLALWYLNRSAFWSVRQLEDRCYHWAQAKGPDTLARWMGYGVAVLIVSWLLWPRVKKGIHWLRHPEESSGQKAPAQPPPTTAPSSSPSSSTAATGGGPVNKGKPHDGSPTTTSGTTNKAAPAPKVVVPIPTDVHYELKTSDLIILRWRPVGPPGLYFYNVYSFTKPDLSSPPRKENTAPMKLSVATWTPETGLDTYWIVVTAVDKQGNESGYSEVIEVVRHPEKSGNSALLDQAAGAVKKVLPW